MHVIIVGCGRVGARLAGLLTHGRHSVAVIDRQPSAFERLRRSFTGTRHLGPGIDRQLLLAAGIDRADALAAVTDRDNTNFVVASIAVEDFHVPRVVASIADPVRAELYARLGVITISPTLWAAAWLHDRLAAPELQAVLSAGDAGVQLFECEVPGRLVGRRVADLALPAEILVVAVTRQGRGFLPVGGTVFEPNDRLLIAADTSATGKLRAMLGQPD